MFINYSSLQDELKMQNLQKRPVILFIKNKISKPLFIKKMHWFPKLISKKG